MTLDITTINYITPEEIKPDYTISAQYITKGFTYLYAPYQMLTAEIKENLIKNIPGEKFLAGFTNSRIEIPDADQIHYFESLVKNYLEEQSKKEYFQKLLTFSGAVNPLANFGMNFEAYKNSDQSYNGPSLETFSSVPGFNEGKVSLAGLSLTPQDIEKVFYADNTIAEPVLFGKYKHEALSELIDELVKREFRGNLQPKSIGCMIYLLIDKSFSMRDCLRLNAAKFAGNVFYKHLQRFYPRDAIKVYSFADSAQRIMPERINSIRFGPYTYLGKSLMDVFTTIDRKLLLPKHIYVFTDGIPHDYAETLTVCEKIKEEGIDFDLVLFKPTDEELEYSLHEFPHLLSLGTKVSEMYERQVVEIAKMAGGNVIVIKQNRLLPAAQISLHEHYKISTCDYMMEQLAKRANLN